MELATGTKQDLTEDRLAEAFAEHGTIPREGVAVTLVCGSVGVKLIATRILRTPGALLSTSTDGIRLDRAIGRDNWKLVAEATDPQPSAAPA